MSGATTATVVAYASIAASIAAAGISAYSSVQQGKAAKAQGKYQQQVMANNQILAQRAAKDARERGKRAEFEQNLKTRQLIGRQNTVLAGNGVLIGQDTALDITTDTAEVGKYDALTIRSNAEREALGFLAQGVNFENQGNLARMSGDATARASNLSAIGSVVGAAGSVAGKWYDFNRAGAFKPNTTGSAQPGIGAYNAAYVW